MIVLAHAIASASPEQLLNIYLLAGGVFAPAGLVIIALRGAA